MNVLEEDDQRPCARLVLEELARPPEDLVERELLPAEPYPRANAIDDVLGSRACRLPELRPCRLRRVLVLDRRGVAHDLDQRPESNSAPVRKAATPEQPSIGSRGRPGELVDQARLANACLGDDRDPAAIAVLCGSSKLAGKQAKLLLPPTSGLSLR